MDLDEARAVLTDPHLTDVGSPLQLAVTAVFDALDAGEVTAEWAARWPAAPADEQIERDEIGDAEIYARRIVRMYPHKAELVQRTVRTWRSPWEVAK